MLSLYSATLCSSRICSIFLNLEFLELVSSSQWHISFFCEMRSLLAQKPSVQLKLLSLLCISMNISTLIICRYVIKLPIFVRSFWSYCNSLQTKPNIFITSLLGLSFQGVNGKAFRFMRHNLFFPGPCCCCLFCSFLPPAFRLISLSFDPLFSPALMPN